MGHGDHHDGPPDEGRDDDGPGRGSVPDPMDRTWVHPTEFAAITPGLGPADPPKSSRVRRAGRWAVPVLAGAAGALLTVLILGLTGVLDHSSSDNGNRQATQQSSPGADASNLPQAATDAGLSVVAIAARDDKGTRRGSGVCIRHGSDVLTSAQVVGGAKSVEIITRDGNRQNARVVGRDATTDLVLLSLDKESDLPAAQLADNEPGAGTHVWVVGASLGAQKVWASDGLVSSNDAIVMQQSGPQTAGLLETDASAGSAATGGALVDDSGDVVGIVLGRVGSGDSTFAVSIVDATNVARQLKSDGVATHGAAGATGTDSMFGPMITKVTDDGPAAKAGLKQGDIVTAVGGRPVESIGDVMGIVRAAEPGKKLMFVVRRGSDEVSADLELGIEKG
jgi:putative serine protease PepD